MSWDPESIKEKTAATYNSPHFLNSLLRCILCAINPHTKSVQSDSLTCVCTCETIAMVKTIHVHQPQSHPESPPALITHPSNLSQQPLTCCLSPKGSLHFPERCVIRTVQCIYSVWFLSLLELFWDVSILLCVLLVCSFVFLNNTLLYGCTRICLSIHLLIGVWVLFHLG